MFKIHLLVAVVPRNRVILDQNMNLCTSIVVDYLIQGVGDYVRKIYPVDAGYRSTDGEAA